MKRQLPNWVWAGGIAILLALCVGFTVWVYLFPRSQEPTLEGPVAVVICNGEVVDAVDLGTVTESFTRTYGDDSGRQNTVEFAPGKARMAEASCPDQNCVSFGWRYGGEWLDIACLPNSVIVRVVLVEPEQSPDVDSATG